MGPGAQCRIVASKVQLGLQASSTTRSLNDGRLALQSVWLKCVHAWPHNRDAMRIDDVVQYCQSSAFAFERIRAPTLPLNVNEPHTFRIEPVPATQAPVIAVARKYVSPRVNRVEENSCCPGAPSCTQA